MSLYFTARIRCRTILIGYDAEGNRISRASGKEDFVEKVIRLDRILSFTDDHLFVACPHDTVEVWDYEGNLDAVKAHLTARDLLVA